MARFSSKLSTAGVAAAIWFLVPVAQANTVFAGQTTTPDNFTGNTPGTLLADEEEPFTNVAGTLSGTFLAAVYLEASGTLDFYYQLSSNTSSTNCGGGGQPVCDDILRLGATSYTGESTDVGDRTDGSSLSGTPFVNGTIAPGTVGRNASGSIVGFFFSGFAPGDTSLTLVVETTATTYTSGTGIIVDSASGMTDVASFEPILPTPEPESILVVGAGLAMVAFRRLRRA